jgi:hypothetical protein
MVPLVKVMVFVPVAAVREADGPHPADTFGPWELLIVTLVGRTSVNEKFVSVVSAGARRLIRSLEFPPASMVLGLKDFPPVIGPPIGKTSTFALAGRILVAPCAVVTVFAGIVFVYVAAVASAGAVTWTVIVQVPGGVGGDELAGIVPPLRVSVRGCVMDTVPPQVVAADPSTRVRTVPGKVSVTLTLVYADPVGF